MKRDDSDALTREVERLVDEAFRDVSRERHLNNCFPLKPLYDKVMIFFTEYSHCAHAVSNFCCSWLKLIIGR